MRAMAARMSRGYTAPVGLLGLTMTMARVRFVMSASISSGSGTNAARGMAGIMHRAAGVEIHRRGPQRIVGARHQHLIAGIQQRAQGQIDQLAHAVADEHFLGRDAAHAALLLLHDDGFARRENALLMHVALAVAQVLDHGQAHGFRGAEAEGVGIADIERDDVVAQALQRQRRAAPACRGFRSAHWPGRRWGAPVFVVS